VADLLAEGTVQVLDKLGQVAGDADPAVLVVDLAFVDPRDAHMQHMQQHLARE
jgi:hypothetical protein